ncbi:MAG TPA: exodeoxyribonuclease VII small subunit [Myxococcota bacterium]|nr:exodeoxyribonuclease VII small subunit [Myxococcota bacterium]
MSAEDKTFDELVEELEQRVRRLESGELALDDALAVFEEGIELTRDCHERLDAKDRRVVELSD